MIYEYEMIQVPPNISVKQREHIGNEAAFYLQAIANQEAKNGWEFYRIDTIGVKVQAGCLAALFGKKDVHTDYYVITFRREKKQTLD